MEQKEANINLLLSTKPELAFIVGVLSDGLAPADFADERKEGKRAPADFADLRRLDFTEFIRLIKHHRLDSIFYRAIKEQNIALPKELESKLAEIDRRNRMRMMKLTAELIRIHKLFTENGIDYISLKGPALSWQIYGDYTVRSSRDLDILVRVEDFVKASDLLKSINYKNNKRFNAVNRFNYKEYKFINSDKKILIELHHRLFNNKFLLPISNNAINNPDYVLINDNEIPVLSKKDNSEYISMHAIVHNFMRMHWAIDFINSQKYILKTSAPLITKYKDYELLDFVVNSDEKELQLIKKMFYLLGLKPELNYKLNELLQRVFIPYRYFE